MRGGTGSHHVLKYNSNVVELALFHVKFTLPPVVFAILTVILVWTSVNVTNCSDGVDGLSGTLSIITIMSIYIVDRMKDVNETYSFPDPAVCRMYSGLFVVQCHTQ